MRKKLLRTILEFLLSTEIWVVGFVVVLSMVSAQALPWAAGIAASFWLIRLVSRHHVSKRTPGDLGIVLLLLMVPVTLWATALPEETIPQVTRLILGILSYYAIVNWAKSDSRIKLLVAGLMAASLGLLVYASISVKWATTKLPFIPTPIYEKFKLLVSDTIHPNVLAGTLVIIFPIAFAILVFYWKEASWGMRMLAGVSTIGITVVLLLTQSRGAIIAFGMVLIMMISFRWRWGWVVVLMSVIVVAILIHEVGLEQILEFVSANQALAGMNQRVEIWSRAIYMIQDFPFTGIGMGSFTEIANLLYPFFLAAPGGVEHAHNLFLQIAVDLGLPGLIAWLSMLISIIAISWRLVRDGKSNGDAFTAALGAGLLCSQLALLTHGMLDAVTWGMVKPAPLVWALWGIAVAAYLLHESKSTNQNRKGFL